MSGRIRRVGMIRSQDRSGFAVNALLLPHFTGRHNIWGDVTQPHLDVVLLLLVVRRALRCPARQEGTRWESGTAPQR
ncbi:hypothetical protein BJY54_006189 [Streptomyces nodosus]|nr:hypothetical protein [Streptomyces nodosus]